MNPLTNRWAALLVIAVLLLGVSELVGTSDNGGVLSRFAAGRPAAQPEAAADAAAAPVSAPAPAVEESEPEAEDGEDDGTTGLEPEDDPFAVADEAETDDEAEPADAGTSIVSSEPPGPPGVVTGEE